jgi:DNA polymerase (family 10)
MINSQIADIFYKIADILEMQNVAWKPTAYRNAARELESLSKDVAEIYKSGGVTALEEIPTIGEALAKKIVQFIETGKIEEYEKLKQSLPMDIEELSKVEGLGPKKILLLYKKLKIKNLKELEAAAKAGKIAKLPRMGEKSEENILKSIVFAKTAGERKPLGYALPIANELVAKLKKLPEIQKIQICGSLARKKETIGDIDILAITKNPQKVMNYFAKLGERIVAKGQTKATIVYGNMEADLRAIPPESFGAAVQYFVGSKEHNVALRKIAISKGFKLSEYGLFRGAKRVAGRNEEEIYKMLGLKHMPFELRENRGEIEAAQQNKLPKLVEQKDILSDLQMHTTYSDGANSVKEMGLACQKAGLKYIAITDHIGQLAVAGAMDYKTVKKQRAEINKLNSGLGNFHILQGAEVDIKLDGSLAADKKILKELDIVLAAIHVGLRRNKKEQTERMVKAIESGCIDIISHPTGRLINAREGYELEWEKIFDAARKNNVALEINAYPTRLDLNDVNARAAKEAGVMLSIGTDAHSFEQLKFLELGVYVARRAWCEKQNIINTMNINRLLKWLKR